MILRRMVAATAVSAMAATLGTIVSPSSAELALPRLAGGCSDVYFVGAAGSGEQRDGGKFGTTVRAVLDRLRKEVGPLEIAADYVAYNPESAELGPLKDVVLVGKDSSFIRGYARGVRELRADLVQRAEVCPREALVISGYSQGAMVAVQALVELGEIGRHDITDRVAAVALVANPFAHREDSSITVGNADARHSGIFKFAGRSARLGTRSWSGRVFEVCTRGDIVCDTAGSLAGLVRQHRSGGTDKHTSYASGREASPTAGTDIRRVATLVARKVDRVPRDATITRVVTRGRTTDVQLYAEGAEAEGLVWRPILGAVPPGLEVSSSGRLTGRATVVGRWAATYEVSNPSFASRAVARVDVLYEVRSSGGAGFTSLPDTRYACAARADLSVVCQDTAPIEGTWESYAYDAVNFCGIKADHSLWCNGENRYGQMADGTYGWEDGFHPLTRIPGNWRQVSLDFGSLCGVQTDNTGWCWGSRQGDNTEGWTGSPKPHPTLEQVPGAWESIRPGTGQTCGITTVGEAYCWGARRIAGQTTQDYLQQVHIPGPQVGIVGRTWQRLDLDLPCGLTGLNTYWCWSTDRSPYPEQPNQFTYVSGARNTFGHVYCGLDFDQLAYCWGDDSAGQVGNGPEEDRVRHQLDGAWRDISVGDSAVCGVRVDQTGWCWGLNADGQLGDGTNEHRDTPVQVPGEWIEIRRSPIYSEPTYGLATDGSLWCWGDADEDSICGSTSPQLLIG